MQELKAKAQAVVDEYNRKFAALGIKIDLSKKYFEATVEKRIHNHSLLDFFEDWYDKKKEKKYKGEKNKYHCLVLTVLPIDTNLVHRDLCRNYAFVLRKVERPHIGMEPQRFEYAESKVLQRIEKRLQRLLKKVQRVGVTSTCKDTLHDVYRYYALPRYLFKTKIRGKDRFFWDVVLSIAAVLIVVGFLVAVHFIVKLF